MNPHQKKNLNNFAFFGTPALASATLDILKNYGYLPSVIITSSDARSGRGMHFTPSPVAIWAEENHIPCLKPNKIDKEFLKEFENFNLEISIVVAYGKILPEKLISFPSFGTINIHYSLLPKYRGASPIESALLNGDKITGVSIQQMEFKLDSGPIIADEEVTIEPSETKEELLSRLIKVGGELLVKILPDIFERKISPHIQNETQASYCKKIKKEDGLIDPEGSPIENYNKYRAYFGWPGVYFFKDNKRIKITKAKYENNSFIIERVIPEGKKETDFISK